MSIYNINQIKAEAIAAAQNPQYKTVNDACPYPFADDAGQLFKKHFESERTWMQRQKDLTPQEIELQTTLAEGLIAHANTVRAITKADFSIDWAAA